MQRGGVPAGQGVSPGCVHPQLIRLHEGSCGEAHVDNPRRCRESGRTGGLGRVCRKAGQAGAVAVWATRTGFLRRRNGHPGAGSLWMRVQRLWWLLGSSRRRGDVHRCGHDSGRLSAGGRGSRAVGPGGQGCVGAGGCVVNESGSAGVARRVGRCRGVVRSASFQASGDRGCAAAARGESAKTDAGQ